MTLVVPTVLVGLVVGYVRGGRLSRLAAVPLRWSWLVAVAVAAQVLLAVSGRGELLGPPLLAASQLALLGFLWGNRRLPGMPLVALGFALNAAVILANGAMPVAPSAMEQLAGGPVAIEPGKHRVLAPGDRLPWLADVIPVPLLRTVVSVGDVVLALGVGWLLVGCMRLGASAASLRRRATAVTRGAG